MTDLTRHNLNELGGQIGWKSIEITLYACLVKLGGRIGQIGWKSIEIMPGQINQAYEADDAQFDQALITGQIGWKSIEMMPGRIGWSNWVEIH